MTWRAGSISEAVEHWSLVPDGIVSQTPSSRLLPVLHRGRPAMLKVPLVEEEAIGGRVLAAWDGIGAAAVFEVDERAIVLERAVGGRDLATLTRDGDDLGAVEILCRVMTTLHTAVAEPRANDDPRRTLPAGLPTLARWFQDLTRGDLATFRQLADPASAAFLTRAGELASRLLAATTMSDTVVLHGDLHHLNVLEFVPGDWRAIDPKGIVGHRAFDASALFSNPDATTATDAASFRDRVDLVTRLTGLRRPLLLDWLIARSALSAVWSLQDGDHASADLVITVGRLAEQARLRVTGLPNRR
ncbi:MAG TPA: aminoglycoside phosphotransferase family protein [Plantibacter sp.]|uniref:aminoglycoside phosphotransferase family protein n=1 Tax=unclassified Plantibacter TaxID=2624265 RepID=UPI002BE90D95|nr:aminoglycoside phosphotransferase family protein [Plantibacter sp.]